MDTKHFSDVWTRGSFPGFKEWTETLPDAAVFSGLAGSSPSFLLADVLDASDGPVFALVADSKQAERVAEECASQVGTDHVSVFPSRDAIPYNMKSPFGPTVEARFSALAKLMAGRKGLYIAPCATLLQHVLPTRQFFNKIIRLQAGDETSQATLATWLTENGFRRESMAVDLGTFAIRGDIFDIYPFITEDPIRLEFWGDTIESIRRFDVFSQKSRATLAKVEIYPMSEFSYSEKQIEDALHRMTEYCEENHLDTAAVRNLEHTWKSLGDPEGIEWFQHWFDVPRATILDYLPQDTTVVWHDLLPLERRMDETRANYERHLHRVPEALRPLVSPTDSLLADTRQTEQDLETFRRISINTDTGQSGMPVYRMRMVEQPVFPQTMDPLIADLKSRYVDGFEVNVICANAGHAQRFLEIMADQCPFVGVFIGTIDRGFVDRDTKRLVYAESQIFSRPHHKPVRARKTKAGTPIAGFDALAPGDFVVHVDHGISQFVGIQRVAAGDVHRDCMVLQYEGASKLYVPVEDFHKVQKYLSRDSQRPTLSKLGTQSWDKLKQRTKKALREMAEELIQLYAKREYMEGIQFSKDSLWQKEFEDAFLFDETPDQHRAIAEVKKDMESKKPMDRLICGDVGFGKTEVALRAAFKAVSDGHQAAILAPTTILVAQHLQTFKERLANFPVKVAMLSRFLSAKEQREVVEKLKSGDVDVVVGTHRLLSKDIAFKNLGLLVVDEEQRFGVRHKEKLKQYRYKVDVLSMTATPIPRTLHLSLLGARDLSIISTPPTNRLPIETHVMEQHDEILQTAIENELDRGGQVYVVHNRIKNLYLLAERLEHLVPRARVIVAHGQMNEKELEKIMKEFIAGRFDVLLSTVIIENGLDIPNVNTIIVNRADAMGLSQLYQLRGRVGRSSEQAYAYFLTPSFKQVSEISLKRLRALEQYTDLGSGFQIAMRDLEIRGAGNILGTRQHGFIAAVGFEMYCRLLKEAVAEGRGEKIVAPEKEVQLDISLEAFLPPEYVSDATTRVSVYQQLSSMNTESEIDAVADDLTDRFGALPEVASALLLLMRIKVLARNAGVAKLSIDSENQLLLQLEGEDETVSKSMKAILGSSSRQFEVSYGTPIVLKTPLGVGNKLAKAKEILWILSTIGAVPEAA